MRDVLLGAEGFDVDIAVEGDAIALARELARLLRGRIRAHEKFGTAVVLYGERGARRRRHHPQRVLRRAGGAALGRARNHP